ncbi:MAG: hypothetical protein EOP14_02740 [Pseudomonas sp.]|nr:MAG: hypothetical protein EOP14_02740 [Pseudomonas sp.]
MANQDNLRAFSLTMISLAWLELSCSIRKKWIGHHRRSLIETEIGRFKKLREQASKQASAGRKLRETDN